MIEPGGPEHRAALAAGAETFETRRRRGALRVARALRLLDVGRRRLLPARAAPPPATLVGDHPELKAGDVLVLAEVAGPSPAGPRTPTRRSARRVRLTSVVALGRPVGRALRRPADERRRSPSPRSRGTPPTRCPSRSASRSRSIPAWSSARRGATSCSPTTAARSRARTSARCRRRCSTAVAAGGCDPCEHDEPEPVPIRFRPTLANAPVTQARPAPRASSRGARCRRARRRSRVAHVRRRSARLARRARLPLHRRRRGRARRRRRLVGQRRRHRRAARASRPSADRLRAAAAAAATLAADPRAARPASRSRARCSARPSRGRRRPTCSAADGDAPEFVVEVETDGTATLRFGDGRTGAGPRPARTFEATYRVGNGVAGQRRRRRDRARRRR